MNVYCAFRQRFSKDEGKRLLILMEEQFRLEEERTVASLQKITEEKTQALDKIISLEVREGTIIFAFVTHDLL